MNWFGGAVGGEENAFELETYPNVDGISFAFRGENIRVDWGDGTIEEYAGPTAPNIYVSNDMYASHSWASTGDGHIIKIDGTLEGVWFGGADTAGSTSTFNYFVNQLNPIYRANYRFRSIEEVAENVAQGSIKKIVNWGTMDTHKVKTAPIGQAIGYNIFFGSPSDLILGVPANYNSGYFSIPYGGYPDYPLPIPNSDYIIPTIVELPPDTGPDLRGVTCLNFTFVGCGFTLDSIGLWDVRGVQSMIGLAEGRSEPSTFNAPIENWETDSLIFLRDAFEDNSVFNRPIGSWNTSSVTDVTETFYNATAFNQDLSNWDLSSCNALLSMFRGASSFNNGGATGIDDWQFGPGTPSIDMRSMFQDASSFNQPIGSWDVSKASSLASTFRGATDFDQDLSNWDLSNVTSMAYMFSDATSFNNGGATGIGNWNTSNVSNMQNVFFNADSFNQPIGSWDVSSSTTFFEMFRNNNGFGITNASGEGTNPLTDWTLNTSAGVSLRNMFFGSWFNSDISNWDVSLVFRMDRLAQSARFNNGGATGIGNWRPTNCSNFFGTFLGAQFNQPIGDWTFRTGTNINMGYMFRYARHFNQDISNWDVSDVTSMELMLADTDIYDQDLGPWGEHLNASVNMNLMLLNSGISTQNYSRTLIGFANYVFDNSGPFNRTFGASPATYHGSTGTTYGGYGSEQFVDAVSARAYLTGTGGWTITDGGTV